MIQLYRDQVSHLEEKIKRSMKPIPLAMRPVVMRLLREERQTIMNWFEARLTLEHVAESIRICDQLTHY